MRRLFCGMLTGFLLFVATPVFAVATQEQKIVITAAENALAMKNMVAMFYVDVAKMAEIERTLWGEKDATLMVEEEENPEIWEVFSNNRINPREDIDTFLGAVVLPDATDGEKPSTEGTPFVGVVFGEFNVEAIRTILKEKFMATEEDGSVLFAYNQDEDTCKMSPPMAIHLTKDGIVLGEPSLVYKAMERLYGLKDAEADLSKWRKWNTEDRTISLAVFEPQGIKTQVDSPYAGMALHALDGKDEEVSGLYFGFSSEADFSNMQLDIKFEANQKWAEENHKAFAEWKQSAKDMIPAEAPTIASLFDLLKAEKETGSLMFNITTDKETAEKTKAVPDEVKTVISNFMGSMFGGGFKMAGGNGAEPEETLLEEKDMVKFAMSYSHDTLNDYSKDVAGGVISGPFAITVDSIRLNAEKDDAVEIGLKVVSGAIQNLLKFSMHEDVKNPQVSFLIKSVMDINGENIMQQEACGKDRTDRPSRLDIRDGGEFVESEYIRHSEVSGEKKVLLKKGKSYSDVVRVDGVIALALPTKVETVRIEAPFADKVFETENVRIKFKPLEGGDVNYDLSGRRNHILDVRALNKDGKYLQASGASASKGGKVASVSRSFQGIPVIVELVVVKAEEVKEYPFSLNKVVPQFTQSTGGNAPKDIPTESKADFLKRVESFSYSGGDECKGNENNVKPFTVCLGELRKSWSNMYQGYIDMVSPLSDLFANKPGSIQLLLTDFYVGEDKFTLPEDKNPAHPFELSKPWEEDKKYLKGGTGWIQMYVEKEDFGKPFTGIGGELIVTLPQGLEKTTLDDVPTLGSTIVKGDRKLMVIGFPARDNILLRYWGKKGDLLQVVPINANGEKMSTDKVQFTDGFKDNAYKDGSWPITVTSSNMPEKLEITFASGAEVITYPVKLICCSPQE